MGELLTIDENTRLRHCEAVIEKSMNSFYEMGVALREIKDSKLYKEGFNTFEEYCSSKWGITRQTGHQYIEASIVYENVSHGLQILPSNERQVRPLTKLKDPELQQKVWQEVVLESNQSNEPITAKKVEQVVMKYCEPCVNTSIEFRVVAYLNAFYRKKLDEKMNGEKESTFIRDMIEKVLDGKYVLKA